MLQGVAVKIASTCYVRMEESVIMLMVLKSVIVPMDTLACTVKGLSVKVTV